MFDKAADPIGISPRCGIILAAGEGTRLQPFIERLRGDSIPKQYVNIIGKRSMLEHTLCRARKLIPSERLFTVVSENHLQYSAVKRQLAGNPTGRVIVQPDNKETGPGLLLPLVHLYKRYPESTVAVFPSDHFVLEEGFFMSYVELAFRVIEKDPSRLVLLGMKPDGPEPEYGYILTRGRPTRGSTGAAAREVFKFIEKPAPVLGQKIVRSGGLWNTMVMVFKARTLLGMVAELAPFLYRSFAQILAVVGTPAANDTIHDVYTHLQPVNFSRGLLESLSAQRPCPVLVLPVHGVYWSDWGSEQRIVSVLEKIGCLARLKEATQNGSRNRSIPAGATSEQPGTELRK